MQATGHKNSPVTFVSSDNPLAQEAIGSEMHTQEGLPAFLTTAMVMPDMRMSVSLNPDLLASVSLGANLLDTALLDTALLDTALLDPELAIVRSEDTAVPDEDIETGPPVSSPSSGEPAPDISAFAPLETDALESDALEIDALEIDAFETDALEIDAFEIDALEIDELATGTPETDPIDADPLDADTIDADPLDAGALDAEPLETDTNQPDPLEPDPLEPDSVATDKEVANMLASITMASEMIDMDTPPTDPAELHAADIDLAKTGIIPQDDADTDIGDVARLIELSRDRADNARAQLAANLAHFAITSGRDLATDEWALLDDIFIRLMQHMEAVVRKALAERIATMEEPPRQLVRALAYDEICVAGPVLRKAERLADEDLVAITRRMTHSHRIAIAERDGLTSLVSEALVEQGEYDVFQTLLKNRTARISKLTFRKLVRASEFDPAIQGLILERNGIPRSLLVEMFWFAAAACRQQIISRFDIELSVLKRQFHEGVEDALIELQTDPVAAAAVNIIQDSKPNCAALLEDLFSKVRAGNLEEIISAVAKMGGFTDTIARQVVLDPAGEALAILCKTMGIQKTQFVQLHLAMDSVRDGTPRPFSHISEITRLYETISWEAAEFILQYWAAENTENKVH